MRLSGRCLRGGSGFKWWPSLGVISAGGGICLPVVLVAGCLEIAALGDRHHLMVQCLLKKTAATPLLLPGSRECRLLSCSPYCHPGRGLLLCKTRGLSGLTRRAPSAS